MARPKKEVQPKPETVADQPETVDNTIEDVEANVVKTEIIEDAPKLKSQPSGRVSASTVAGGGPRIVYLHNSLTGNTVPINATAANRLIRNNPDQYSLHDGKK